MNFTYENNTVTITDIDLLDFDKIFREEVLELIIESILSERISALMEGL